GGGAAVFTSAADWRERAPTGGAPTPCTSRRATPTEIGRRRTTWRALPPDMPGSHRLCPDVVFTVNDGGVVASNHRARRHVWLSVPLFGVLVDSIVRGELRARDVTRFAPADGLLADPTGLDLTQAADSTLFADVGAALSFLAARFIVMTSADRYDEYFAPKRSLLDRQHFGTFHQQLGAELRLRRRVDPAAWWYEQKFDPT